MATNLEYTFIPLGEGHTLASKDKPSIVNNEVITDGWVAKCRFDSRTVLVDYGNYDNHAACLVGFEFTFHPYQTRFQSAEINVAFVSADVENPNSEKVVKDALEGAVKIGYQDLAVIQATASRATEKVTGKYMEILGSRVGKNGVRWTLEENSNQKDGLPRSLIGYVVLAYSGPFEAKVKVTAKVGLFVNLKDFIIDATRLITGQMTGDKERDGTTSFDTKTVVDRRPDLTKACFQVKNWAPAEKKDVSASEDNASVVKPGED
ncbi:hypothetical protein BGZ57DRAFT_862545 [Hyaloscypha finlandica]|nr:hypothetical protein BGZ57DRAFT_862545 [Hyaloscypha finlandica]